MIRYPFLASAFLLPLLLPALAFAAPAQTSSATSHASCRALSNQFLQNVQNGDFKAATAHFDKKMKAGLSAQKLKQLWQQALPKEHGAFERAGTPGTVHKDGHTAIITPLKFAHGWQNMFVSCNEAHEIEGLFFRPTQAPESVSSTAPQAANASQANAGNLQAYTGRYRLAPHFVLKIFRKGDQLYAQATNQSAIRIYPSARNEFFAKVVSIRISFQRNSSGKVSGLVLHQHGDHPAPRITANAASSASAPATIQTPTSATAWITTAAVGANTLPITVQRDGFVLKGVLDLPAGKGPFGVVDIIPGSGSVDLNGNAGPLQFDMYKQLAASLVQAGWAVARVTKRGMPPSTGDGNNIVFADQVADNLAIVKILKNNQHINPRRIIVAGHSIGGLIAPKLATETELAGLILLEAPGEKMAKIIAYQTLRPKRQAGANATKLAAAEAHIIKLNSLVAKAPPGETVSAGKESSIFARIFAHSPEMVQLFKSWYAQNPLATARNVNIPVLVVQGGQDVQTPPGNGKRLVKALPHGELLYLPEMDHDLTLEQEGIGKDATLAPGLTAGIVDWLDNLKESLNNSITVIPDGAQRRSGILP